MSWKAKSLSIFRRTFSRKLFDKSNLKKDIKARQKSSDCCATTSKTLFDEAPVPEGCWAEHFKRRDEMNTKILAIGAGSFVITMAVVQKKGLARGHPEISLLF